MALATVGLTLAMNYGIHIGSSLAYGYLCVPYGIADFLNSVVLTASPVCSTLLTIMQATQTNYATILTATLVKFLTP
jgi:hypothetical protein